MNFLKWTSKKFGNFRRGNAVYNLIPYVLIGGGTASYYASMTIRARDPDARVLIIGQEEETPYRRSVLSKELWWYGDAESSSTFSYISPINNKRKYGTYEADGFYFLPEELDQWEHGGIAFMSGAKVDKLDAENNFVQLENGQKIEFEKCLIATGSASPFKDLASDPDLTQHISVLHDVNDYRKLHKKMEELNNAAENNKNIVILGGGLLGAELAYSLNRRYARDNEGSKLRIIQVAQEHGILSEILPQSLSDHSTETLRSQGVELILGTSVDAITRRGNKILLTIAPTQQQISGTKEEPETLQCDHLILANDVEPQIELVEKSNLTIDKKNGGVLADSLMHVKGNIWAAGDVCSFFDETLGYRRRCAHWQHAQITGRIAGENMTSGNKTYTHQGAFVTMLGPKAHICGIGDTNPNKFDSNVVLSEKDSSNNEPRAVVFYTDRESKKIKGILLYNVLGFGEEMARKLIRDMHPFNESAAKEYTKLFELWEADDGSAAEKIEGESLLTDDEVDAYQRRED